METKEKLRMKLEQELRWVEYRQKMLDIMDEKLLQMRCIAEQAKEKNLSLEEIKALNVRISSLAAQVDALDSESRRLDDGIWGMERIVK